MTTYYRKVEIYTYEGFITTVTFLGQTSSRFGVPSTLKDETEKEIDKILDAPITITEDEILNKFRENPGVFQYLVNKYIN